MGDAPEIVDALLDTYGERCLSFNNGCAGCRAWRDYDLMVASAAREAELRAEVERLTRALESAVETVEQSAIKRGVAEAEVERLKSEASGWRTVAESNGVMAQSHSAEAAQLRGLLNEAREALTFYANQKGDGYDVMVTDYGLSTDEGPIIQDGGTIASATLARIGGQHD